MGFLFNECLSTAELARHVVTETELANDRRFGF